MDKIEDIWLNLRDRLKLFILSKIPDNAAADDILQEVFIRMHLKIDSLKDNTKFRSWIYQITRNLIIDHFRNEKSEKQLNQSFIDGTDERNPTNKLLEVALNDMIEMMDNLPPEYCEALCLTELEGLTQKEYAERTGISYSGAKSRVQRSRKMLKEMLMNCCHYEFDKYGTVINISPKSCCCCNPIAKT